MTTSLISDNTSDGPAYGAWSIDISDDSLRRPLEEQTFPEDRGGIRAVQPGMPFPNVYRWNKVLVYQNK